MSSRPLNQGQVQNRIQSPENRYRALMTLENVPHVVGMTYITLEGASASVVSAPETSEIQAIAHLSLDVSCMLDPLLRVTETQQLSHAAKMPSTRGRICAGGIPSKVLSHGSDSNIVEGVVSRSSTLSETGLAGSSPDAVLHAMALNYQSTALLVHAGP
ncbi:hypothetical protein BO86DRAFT_401554 [Aspergillus japonicus CBS 114.51]|uniref:Uncharacterized protein n=1 Tax=Aspergillus japonicus CBS 114.51 TaxID=1448312 RepID=A0A8T8WWR8_ASPJA|nr:hypothetical protein BO86DRAFT_401554 [Aspergillus japonicus CBS 114.51]RAH79739.1 hypothetical protein BO86DRAFT_401554 [Aspergillus japonicus CBS 114.51]